MELVERRWSSIFAITILLLAGQFTCSVCHGILDDEVFDFIIVGGGTSGCVLASRLAEDGENKILLIESGGIPNPLYDIPVFSPRASIDSNVAKLYPMVPQQNAGLAYNGKLNLTRGNVLGGGSGINGMVVNRGSPHDYNNWARLTGDESWNYVNLLKYFRKYENYAGAYPSNQHGFNGPIPVEAIRYAPGLTEWLQAGSELGYPVTDPNGPQIIGFSAHEFAHKRGRRVSSFKGYIEPMINSESSPFPPSAAFPKQKNLIILINTEVTKITFEGTRAEGVIFRSNSTNVKYARARKEIILSAGAVETPVLLMKSGIGPKSVLESANIPAIQYLPVGSNLHDHPSAPLTVVLGNRSAAINETTELTPEAWRLFTEFGDGPYASYQGQCGQAFIASSVIPAYEKSLGWADIQIITLHSNSETPVLGASVPVSDLKEWEFPVRWSSLAARPKSRGTVKLDPRNPDGLPLVDLQYLTHPNDIKVLVDGIKASIRICEDTSSFQRIGCRIPNDVLPACSRFPFRSDLYWQCYIRELSNVGYHNVGTCRMGSGPKDPQAVVDTKLRVLGIDGLRVADASIMPTVTNANTMAVVYAIAEKAADMILEHWRSLRTSAPKWWNNISFP